MSAPIRIASAMAMLMVRTRGGYVPDSGDLPRDGNGSRRCERAGEFRQDGEVSVKLDALKSTDAERASRG
jgi:hypothetical protein